MNYLPGPIVTPFTVWNPSPKEDKLTPVADSPPPLTIGNNITMI